MTASPESPAPVAALREIAWLPHVVIAIVLTTVAVTFMNGGTLNIEGFVAVQVLTQALPDTAWALVTICGTGVVAFALLAPTLNWQPRWYAAGLVAAPLAGLYSNGMKRVFGLPRPASMLEPGHLHIIGETLRANAFPSGHSVTAFTLASILVLGSRHPLRTATWAVPMACLIAVSRIAVGAHWPADIAAGAAGGWICGALAVMVIVRWRRWNTATCVRCMGVVSIGIGVSLLITDLGYPLAIPLQQIAAGIALVAGAVAVARPRLDPLLPGDPAWGGASR